MTPLIHLVAAAVRDHGTAPYAVDGERTINRREALAYGAAFVRELEALGARRGAHVAVMLPNNLAWIGCHTACLLGGYVLVAVNPLVTPKELAQLRKTGRFDYLVTGGPLLQLAATLEGCKVLDAATVAPRAEDAAAAPNLLSESSAVTTAETPFIIIFTSGTTGASKAALLSHGNLGTNAVAAKNVLGVDERDSALLVLPLFHSFGILLLDLVLTIGAKVVLQPRFVPSASLDLLIEHRITVSGLVPPMIALLARLIAKRQPDLSALRFIISGGSALPRAVYDAWRAASTVELLGGYGQTESSPLISVTEPGDDRYPAVGPPVEHVSVEIWDDTDRQVAPGEIGEVVVRGPNVMLGYYGDPEATARTITPEGWLRTGDFGTMNTHGHLAITGRKKELIIVAGENVYPVEIEEVIDAVEGVMENAVVAGFDDLRGEFVRACVVPAPNPDNPEAALDPDTLESLRERILATCREHLSAHKVPRTVEYLKALPRNTLGKVLKRELEQRGPAR